LGKSSKHNNEIIKEILAIYFAILKGESGAGMRTNDEVNASSPLLKTVFLGIPQFT